MPTHVTDKVNMISSAKKSCVVTGRNGAAHPHARSHHVVHAYAAVLLESRWQDAKLAPAVVCLRSESENSIFGLA